MKHIITIIVTFIVAFATSALLEFYFISGNWVRYTLVVLLIFLEIAIGVLSVVDDVKNNSKNKNNVGN